MNWEPYTNCNSTRLPQAFAYLRIVSNVGEWRGSRSELSRRETALLEVPIRMAISSWVRLDCLRASSSDWRCPPRWLFGYLWVINWGDDQHRLDHHHT